MLPGHLYFLLARSEMSRSAISSVEFAWVTQPSQDTRNASQDMGAGLGRIARGRINRVVCGWTTQNCSRAQYKLDATSTLRVNFSPFVPEPFAHSLSGQELRVWGVGSPSPITRHCFTTQASRRTRHSSSKVSFGDLGENHAQSESFPPQQRGIFTTEPHFQISFSGLDVLRFQL